MPKKSSNDGLINFYETMPKSFIKKYHNPHYEDHMIQVPCRIGIFSGSGGGKTLTILNIIKKMSSTFNKIVICTKNSDEPLYNYLQSKLKMGDEIDVFENGEIPPMDDYTNAGQVLMIFDDLVNTKSAQPAIQEYFIRARKIGGGISLIYSSQSYFGVPKNIRLQMNYIILKRLNSLRDLSIILSDHQLGMDKKKFYKLYNECVKDSKTNFFMIRCEEGDVNDKFTKNFTGRLDVECCR